MAGPPCLPDRAPPNPPFTAYQVRRLRVQDALLQLEVLPKKAAKIVYNTLKSAQANAVHNHNLDKRRLIVGTWKQD